MRFRLPSPRDGWRTFAGDVGVIVLGVVIALSADQIVNNYLNKREAQASEAALKAELRFAFNSAVERILVEQCLANRLSHLASKLNREGEFWTADAEPLEEIDPSVGLPAVYRAPKRIWAINIWQTAVSTGAIQHMRRERVLAFSNLYESVASLRDNNGKEADLAARLGPLRSGGRLTAQAAWEASMTVAELDRLNQRISRTSRQYLKALKAMQLGYAAEETDISEMVSWQRGYRGACVNSVRVTL